MTSEFNSFGGPFLNAFGDSEQNARGDVDPFIDVDIEFFKPFAPAITATLHIDWIDTTIETGEPPGSGEAPLVRGPDFTDAEVIECDKGLWFSEGIDIFLTNAFEDSSTFWKNVFTVGPDSPTFGGFFVTDIWGENDTENPETHPTWKAEQSAPSGFESNHPTSNVRMGFENSAPGETDWGFREELSQGIYHIRNRKIEGRTSGEHLFNRFLGPRYIQGDKSPNVDNRVFSGIVLSRPFVSSVGWFCAVIPNSQPAYPKLGDNGFYAGWVEFHFTLGSP